MYFKEKEDTNIDAEFKKDKKIEINPKLILYIIGGILILVGIIILIISLTNGSNKYTIELYGNKEMTILLGTEYVEPGFKAYDKKNNDLTDKVEIIDNINTSKVGEYEVLYSIGKTSIVRYVSVKEQATIIDLYGELNIYLEVGEKYIEPGYKVYDSINNDLTKKVKIKGEVNNKKIGTYEIIYSVVNDNNETITARRTVVVVKKGQKPTN